MLATFICTSWVYHTKLETVPGMHLGGPKRILDKNEDLPPGIHILRWHFSHHRIWPLFWAFLALPTQAVLPWMKTVAYWLGQSSLTCQPVWQGLADRTQSWRCCRHLPSRYMALKMITSYLPMAAVQRWSYWPLTKPARFPYAEDSIRQSLIPPWSNLWFL